METSYHFVKAVACLAAAIVMGVGSIGPSLGQGLVAMKACENIGKYPESAANIRFLMIIGMSLVETSSLFCLLISLLLIFTV